MYQFGGEAVRIVNLTSIVSTILFTHRKDGQGQFIISVVVTQVFRLYQFGGVSDDEQKSENQMNILIVC